ncbi:Initiation factor 3-1 [Hibiscus trionum]|uniref:Initiation factor 3-1 n=1 Tax=Hibiscus trionum TaxID=183268 RepID=A0A9W7JH41_HIBTR|nr:Initiation factor 3-1 [Hibiscus trionum]
MAFWRRINQSKLQLISNQYRRFYFQAPHASSVHQTRISALEKPIFSIDNKPSYFYCNVRSFAAPVQATKNKKAEQQAKEKPRLNKQITARVVRLVTQDGQHSVVSIEEALQQARKQGVDLVEVQKKVDPPVCRLMDYNKETYQRRLKEKEIAKSKAGETVKKGVCNIRFTGKIEEKDLKLKAENVKRLIERGYRVKCMAMAKGKEDEAKEDLGGILSRLTKLIEGVCVVESGPNVEKTNAYVIVKHIKFGPTKKGGKKSKVADGDMVETSTESATDNQRSVDESTESGSESEDATFSDEDDPPMSSPVQMQDENVDNRYKSSEQRKQFPPGSSVRSEPQLPYPQRELPNMSQSARESVRSEPQFLYPPRQPPPHMGQNTRQVDRSEPQFPYPPRQPPPHMGQNTRQVDRSEPQFSYPPRQPPPHMGQNTRQADRSEPQFPYQRRQPPQNMNAPSSAKGTKQVEDEASKPPKSFGIFSSLNANSSGKQSTTVDAPVSNEGNRYASVRNRGMGGNVANSNSAGSQFNGNRKPDNSTSGQDKFGVFSTPNRKP